MTNTPSIDNLLTKDERPEIDAIVCAFKADMARVIAALAEKHSDEKNNHGFPGAVIQENTNRISRALGRDLLADVLDADCVSVIDAVLACDRVQRATVWGKQCDYETPTAELMQGAEDLADATCDVCRLGEAA